MANGANGANNVNGANGVFISYRRSDAAGFAGRIADFLAFERPNLTVFMDVMSIRPGDDFIDTINDRLAASGTVLALIGERWLDEEGASGGRRLDDPQDFVRLELELALGAGTTVVPVLLDDARMPAPDELPESLRQLTRRNAFHLRHHAFRRDIDALADIIQHATEGIAHPSLPADDNRFPQAVIDALEAAFQRYINMDDPEVYMIVSNPDEQFVQFIGMVDGEVLLDLPSQNLSPRQLVAAQRFLQESYAIGTQDLGDGALALQTILPAQARHLARLTLTLFEHVHEAVPDKPLEITFGK